MKTNQTRIPSTQCRGELLIVDDSASSLAYLSALLTQAGFQVREAPSGELALMTLRVRVPELILLDVRMPEIDGYEVCRRIKSSPDTQDVPVIFLSAQDESTDKVRGLQVGAVDFIGKSFTPEEMLARIDTHIALARTKQALEDERRFLEDRVRERTAELSQERKLLKTVIDSGPDWIYAIDRQHRFLLVNQSMARELVHHNPADLIGKDDCLAFHCNTCSNGNGRRRCEWHENENKVFDGHSIHNPVERLVLPNGEHIIFETYKTPLRDADNAVYGLLCYRRNITQRLRMEEKNLSLERALWQAKKMEAVGQLAGGIAHDFNHLLSLILGHAQFARTAIANNRPEKLDSYISEILKAGTEGQAVVSQLLAFSRVEEPANIAIDVSSALIETVNALRQVTQVATNLSLEIDTTVPQAFIKTGQLKQLVTNLVLNSRDAISGNEDGKISVRLSQASVSQSASCASCRKPFTGQFLTLSVEDNGEGIPASSLDRLFEPFFTTKDIGKGSGLGLPMVHGVMHSVGGHICISSTVGQGTLITLYMPVVK
jgi:signal transduction histidine kinase/FixJ family two-component response regulator